MTLECAVLWCLSTGSDCCAGQSVCSVGLSAVCSRTFDVSHNTSARTQRLWWTDSC